ncbi:DegV family EDD domain-containing protein [Candidatus Bipolaricaulota bacterium]|nr:DegV family EDD domain-containing protein [Candidatus Bipolaricaulota bacterium]
MNQAYLTGDELRLVAIAGAKRVILHADHLDRINVFPVPDGDTGKNLAQTMRAIIHGVNSAHGAVADVSSRLADAALRGARGNSGVIMAQYLRGFSDATKGKLRVSAVNMAAALRHAASEARRALEDPREGTILTVMQDVADAFAAQSARITDMVKLFEEGIATARRSLAATTGRLAVLKRAGVVDAGALGFVHFLEGWLDALRGGSGEVIDLLPEPDAEEIQQQVAANVGRDWRPVWQRYCCEGVVRFRNHAFGGGDDCARIKKALAELGDSVVVATGQDVVHVHTHTNMPAYVFELLTTMGARIVSSKVEDMLLQVGVNVAEEDRVAIGIVTDTVCDLPTRWLVANDVLPVAMKVSLADREMLDGVDTTATSLLDALERDPETPPAATSQPSPGQFLEVYRHLAAGCRSIISVHLSQRVSGTVQNAMWAAAHVERESGVPIHVVDTGTASAGEGLVLLAIRQAAEAGLSAADCARVGRDVARHVRLQVYVPSVLSFVRGGRLSPRAGGLLERLKMTPILTVRKGKMTLGGMIVRRRKRETVVLRNALRWGRNMCRPIFALAHAGAADLARQYGDAIKRQFVGAPVYVSQAAAALSSHSGSGGIVVAAVDGAVIDRAIEAVSQESA